MSRSNYSYPREKTLRFFGKRTGWYGEQCWKQEGIDMNKRHKEEHNAYMKKKTYQFNNELIRKGLK